MSQGEATLCPLEYSLPIMRNWLDNDETSIPSTGSGRSLSSAERSGARIEGCELAKIQRVRCTLRYDLRSATVYSATVLVVKKQAQF